jgi:uncharacterized RDD family membrane protein YckC
MGSPAPSYRQATADTGSSAGYGGFWIRLVALVVDTIIVRLAVFPIVALLSFMGLRHRDFFITGRIENSDIPALMGTAFAAFWVFVLVNWLYEALLTSSAWQGTVGKKILGLRVTDEAGNRISFGRASGRHFAKYLSAIFLVGFIMAAFTDRKRALHDMMAGTLVRKS